METKEKEMKTLKESFSSERDVVFHFWKTGLVGRHAHEYFEIFLITEGRVRHEFEGEFSTLQKGDLALIKPWETHSFLPFDGETTVHFNVKIPPVLFKSLCAGIHHELFSNLSAKKELTQYKLKPHEFEYFSQTIQSVNACPANRESSPIVKALIFNFLSYFHACMQTPSPLYPQWLSDFLEVLNTPENFLKPLSQLYGKSTYSQTRLNTYFHRYTGMSIVAYFTKQKLNYASNLLQSTNYTVAQIAYASGFNNLSNFNAVFKKAFQETPSSYREKFNVLNP